jgi:P-type Ca2+ transporter type 2C
MALNSTQAREKLQKYGPNVLPEKQTESIYKAIFSQANNLLNYVLIAAVIFSALSSHWVDFWVILIILILNTAISTYHHIKARKVVDSLSQGFKEDALVLRDGKFVKLPAEKLVPGDVVNLRDGDKFPADIRFIQANGVSCAEASLTGESTSVVKNILILAENTPLAYQANMGFKGTIMLTGEAQAVVVATGSETQIGKIAVDLKNIKEEKTLFEKRTERLIKQMVLVTAITSLTILTLGYFRGIETGELVLFVLAALISGIPEGLPTVLMVVLSIAAFRMSRRKAILKKLKAIESLSSVTTIITDKTGTLTENTMNVGIIKLADGMEVKVSGTGWKPEGDFLIDGRKIQPLNYPVLKKLLEMSGFNDQADVVKTKTGYESIGDPTEASRIVMSRKAKVTPQYLAQKYLLVTSTPYDQQTKYRQNIVKDTKKNVYYLVVVGGAENVVKRCNRKLVGGEEEDFRALKLDNELDLIKNYAGQAYRMQAVAYSELDSKTAGQIEKKQFASEKLNDILISIPLVYLGSLAINDPVRADVPSAVASAQKAGIRVVMATGDHPDTAKAVGQICGIDQHGRVLTESEIENIGDEELLEKLQTVRIFARMTPSGKKRIADLLQTSGELIAMTGDGTNDAPALKSADVGIAMGEIGTDAAREASDLIILDDNFATIISAIEEGRTVFRNVRQTSLYLLTTNFAEDLLLVFALVLKMPLPLLPLQILWLNLVTDGVSGVSLATEKPQATTLTSPPRKRTEGILGRKNLIFIGVVAFVMMVLSLGIFTWGLRVNEDYARTVAFTFLVFCQLFNMINLRSLDLPISEIGFFSNKAINISFIISTGLLFVILYIPFLRDIFRFAAIDLMVVLVLFALSFLIFVTGEVLKRAKLII